jgi:uncharacterized repeat protein (TIGR03809 family)
MGSFMNETLDLNRGRALVQRWCVLSEQRLDYLTELFETGRWRRYFDEVGFLENIQEAKRAVGTWRALLEREASSDNRPVDLSWLGRRPHRPVAPIRFIPEPQPAATVPAAPAELPESVAAIAFAPPAAPIEEPVADEVDPIAWTRALDPDILQQRYPILRNAL